jgi:hypothetical protein
MCIDKKMSSEISPDVEAAVHRLAQQRGLHMDRLTGLYLHGAMNGGSDEWMSVMEDEIANQSYEDDHERNVDARNVYLSRNRRLAGGGRSAGVDFNTKISRKNVHNRQKLQRLAEITSEKGPSATAQFAGGMIHDYDAMLKPNRTHQAHNILSGGWR